MALGRGLSEILGEVEAAYENNIDNRNLVKDIEIDKIEPNPYQPRKIFDEEKLEELSRSIISHGLLQPVVVIKKLNKYILIAGERRFRASKLANFETIKAIILDIDEKKLREYALIENIQRDDLNILEVAYSYAGLINEYNMTHEELANMVFKSRSSITNTLRLLTLSVYTQQLISANKISQGHAKLLVGLKEEEQRQIVDSIIGQRLSVRETEALVKNLKEKNNNDEKVKSEKIETRFNFKKFENVISKLKNQNIDMKIHKNNIKITINSQEDIEKILQYFEKDI
ncbi:MAG: ParB/RepB/Spo0J family partition protein [Arcobacteraceae bacterium]|jgi:ParB family chromosome partitioning protein|nr:ParB/RepB/Spo0J family partition protein [Arcobacteraceae bacterium]